MPRRPRSADLLDKLAADDVVTRGVYDLSGFRADADVLVWWHAGTPQGVQDAYTRFRRTRFGRGRPGLEPGSAAPAGRVQQGPRAGVHDRRGSRGYVCVYPFVRSYEWYLLADEERRALLAEHGQMAREYADVRANTVASFALGDYEWILAFEADELHRIVDLMRHLRASGARRHVREEIPFYTGPRVEPAELLTRLP